MYCMYKQYRVRPRQRAQAVVGQPQTLGGGYYMPDKRAGYQPSRGEFKDRLTYRPPPATHHPPPAARRPSPTTTHYAPQIFQLMKSKSNAQGDCGTDADLVIVSRHDLLFFKPITEWPGEFALVLAFCEVLLYFARWLLSFYFNVLILIVFYSTLLYSTLLYSTLLYSTLLYSTLLYSTLLSSSSSPAHKPTQPCTRHRVDPPLQ